MQLLTPTQQKAIIAIKHICTSKDYRPMCNAPFSVTPHRVTATNGHMLACVNLLDNSEFPVSQYKLDSNNIIEYVAVDDNDADRWQTSIDRVVASHLDTTSTLDINIHAEYIVKALKIFKTLGFIPLHVNIKKGSQSMMISAANNIYNVYVIIMGVRE